MGLNIPVLDYLHILLSNNVLGDKQYQSRYKGFVGELAFQERIIQQKKTQNYYSSGYLLPIQRKNRSVINPIYFTVSSDNPDRYVEIYKHLSKLPCEKMYFIQWDNNIAFSLWPNIQPKGFPQANLKVPKFHVYEFDIIKNQFFPSTLDNFISNFPLKAKRTSSEHIPNDVQQNCKIKLSGFSQNLLIDLYVQRLIFDGYIGYSREHGMPSDIDTIFLCPKTNQFLLIEIKEKDLSKWYPQGFGMDVDRIKDLAYLQDKTGLPVHYIVRQVNNQSSRQFMYWREIDLETFINKAVDSTQNGGSGMGFAHGVYLTKICADNFFRTLK